MSVVGISPSISTKFGSKQSKRGLTNLRDSHAHVLAISKFCPYEYKQALFCMIAGAVLHIALNNGCSCISCQLLTRRFFSLVLIVDSIRKGKILLCSFYFCWKASFLSLNVHFRESFLEKILRVPSVKKVSFEVFNSLFT